MSAYLVRRALGAVPMLLGVSVVLFILLHLAPGGPEAALLGGDLSQQDAAALRRSLGLDQPLPVQYVRWLTSALRGNLGISYLQGVPVLQVIGEHVGATVQLAAGALALAIAVAVPLGVVSATRPNTWIDRTATGVALAGVSFPSFWLGILLILLFASTLRWLPASGYGAYGLEGGGTDHVRHLILPVVTLAGTQIASFLRFTRSSMLEALAQPYITVARAKGLREVRVLLRHAFRNGLIPLITLLGLSLRFLIGGAVLTETVFAWPGIGRLSVDAVIGRDYPLLLGLNLLIALAVIAGNVVTDLLYSLADPRIVWQ
ncbi:MAG TPA: ABC transporter permease [bacterium]|nr:ABC transporter permease [bacterium]